MKDPILHINPNELNDIASLRAGLVQALNFIDSLLEQNQMLLKQNQELRDEINRLKGEKGKPNILPNSKKSVDISSQTHSEEKKDWLKKSKKTIIPIDQKITCPIDRGTLPADARFKGYETVIGQDIIFKRNN